MKKLIFALTWAIWPALLVSGAYNNYGGNYPNNYDPYYNNYYSGYPNNYESGYPNNYDSGYPNNYASDYPNSYDNSYPDNYDGSYPSNYDPYYSTYGSGYPSEYDSAYNNYDTAYPYNYDISDPNSYDSGYPNTYDSGYPNTYEGEYPTSYDSGYPDSYDSVYPNSYDSGYPTNYESSYPNNYVGGYPNTYGSGYPNSYGSGYPSSYGNNYSGSNYNIREDPLGYDPKLEIVHLYRDQWPTGIAVSTTGRIFSSYPSALDPKNGNDGRNGAYQVAELTGYDTETPYPNAEYNSPRGGLIDYSQKPPVTRNLPNNFISVNALFVSTYNFLFILDTGRTRTKSFIILPASGGTKVVTVDLSSNSVRRTYTFPTTVAYPTSFFCDLRVDDTHRAAYISDCSAEGNNALVVLDLISGKSWRKLENDPSVQAFPGFLPFVWGAPNYHNGRNYSGEVSVESIPFGVSGVAVSNDSETLFFATFGGRYVYSIPTALLLDPVATTDEISPSVQNLGEKGWGGALACDSQNQLWSGNAENDGISLINVEEDRVVLYIRDKRINFVYSFSVGTDGYLYCLCNQLNYYPGVYPGEGPLFQDRREKPYVLFRFELPNVGSKRG